MQIKQHLRNTIGTQFLNSDYATSQLSHEATFNAGELAASQGQSCVSRSYNLRPIEASKLSTASVLDIPLIIVTDNEVFKKQSFFPRFWQEC